jgi:hypothetical protein
VLLEKSVIEITKKDKFTILIFTVPKRGANCGQFGTGNTSTPYPSRSTFRWRNFRQLRISFVKETS